MDEQKIKDIATKVFTDMLQQTQYNVSSIPFHTHSTTDSGNIPPSSVINFVPLPATNGSATVPAGVLSRLNISVATPPYNMVYPQAVIRGVGVGTFSVFNGGSAPFGSTVVFLPGDSTLVPPQLWIMLDNSLGVPTWYGVDLPLTA